MSFKTRSIRRCSLIKGPIGIIYASFGKQVNGRSGATLSDSFAIRIASRLRTVN
jgi:hypothetical protein